MYRMVIANGLVVDGSGGKPFVGNVYIAGDRIERIDKEKATGQHGLAADRVIDATDLIVAPGFVDIHTHSDTTILSCPTGDSKLTQGITTEIGGNCGYSMFPVDKDRLDELKEFLSIFPGKRDYSWSSARGFLDAVEERKPAVNFGSYVGHSAVRLAIKGFDKSPSTPDELARMKYMVLQALDEGAVGLSLGLAYPPGSFAEDFELHTLMAATASKGKIVSIHVRDEADFCVESVRWVIEAAKKTGASVEISHLKSMGKSNWGKVRKSLELISDARANGLDITVDVYPYAAINTTLVSMLPDYVISGGIEAARTKLQDQTVRDKTIAYLRRKSNSYGGWENIVVASTANISCPEKVVGKSIRDVAGERGDSPEQTAIDIAMESLGSTMIVCFSMNEEDVLEVFRAPFSLAGSDGKILRTEGPLSEGRPHPRNYGAFPRIIRWVVKERKALSLEEAIRKMTSMPAERVGVRERGLIRAGYFADLVLFSFDEISDMATFEKPHQYCKGIRYVIVNGEVTFENERIVKQNGRTLRLQSNT